MKVISPQPREFLGCDTPLSSTTFVRFATRELVLVRFA
jgi:hypothetical protein